MITLRFKSNTKFKDLEWRAGEDSKLHVEVFCRHYDFFSKMISSNECEVVDVKFRNDLVLKKESEPKIVEVEKIVEKIVEVEKKAKTPAPSSKKSD